MSYKNILIGIKPLFQDWLASIKKINKSHILVIDFNNNNIIKIIHEQKINFILPLSDKDYNIIKNIQLVNTIKILYPAEETIELLHNKVSFTKFMLTHFNQCIPDVYYLNNEKIKNIEYPVIFKPTFSTNGKHMKLYHNENEFLKCTEKTIVQKFIENEYEYSAFMLCINGIIINSKIIRSKFKQFNIKTHHFPKNYENIDDFNLNLFKPIISTLNYTGGICIDFKFDETTNKLYIFEINPRFGGSAFAHNFIYELLCIKT